MPRTAESSSLKPAGCTAVLSATAARGGGRAMRSSCACSRQLYNAEPAGQARRRGCDSASWKLAGPVQYCRDKSFRDLPSLGDVSCAAPPPQSSTVVDRLATETAAARRCSVHYINSLPRSAATPALDSCCKLHAYCDAGLDSTRLVACAACRCPADPRRCASLLPSV